MTATINWESQWALHSPVYHKGKAHVPLSNNQKLLLTPGPGFGDFSHPTTQLMLQMIPPFVQNKPVFDIGCGSGILSVAAAKLGSTQVFSCDIDPLAEEHAKENGLLNQTPLFFTPPPFTIQPVILMNMIYSEQKMAWETHRRPFDTLITSGILATDTSPYLNFAKQSGWKLIKQQELNGWMGFIFKGN